MKNYLHFILLLALIVMLPSCGTGKYIQSYKVKIEGTPNVDYYALHQSSSSSRDGFADLLECEAKISTYCKGRVAFLGSSNDNGELTIGITTDQHNKSNGIYAVKSGYDPQRVKLRKRFNWTTLANIFFPPNFFFDHYRVVSKRKINKVNLDDKCNQSAYELFEKALNAKKTKDKIELYKRAFAQDYRNELEIAAKSLNNIAILYASQGDVHEAYLLLKFASKYNSDDVAHNMLWLKNVAMQLNYEKHRKEERFNQTMNALQGIGSALQATGNAIGSYKAQSSSTYSGSSQSNYTTPKVSNSSSSSTKSNTQERDPNWGSNWIAQDRIYRDYETQLIKMQSEIGASKYQDIQNKMKQIRLKCESKGWPITKSKYE